MAKKRDGMVRMATYEGGMPKEVWFTVGKQRVLVNAEGVFFQPLDFRTQKVGVGIVTDCPCCGELNEFAWTFNGQDVAMTVGEARPDGAGGMNYFGRPVKSSPAKLDELRAMHRRGEG